MHKNFINLTKYAGMVIWITGLPGSGKTTLALELRTLLLERFEKKAVILDGDELRKMLGPAGKSYDAAGRIEIGETYVRACYMLASQGFDVILSAVGLSHDVQHYFRELLPGINHIQVLLAAQRELCRSRKPDIGYWSNNLTPEFPKSPELVIEPEHTPRQAAELILDYLKEHDALNLPAVGTGELKI